MSGTAGVLAIDSTSMTTMSLGPFYLGSPMSNASPTVANCSIISAVWGTRHRVRPWR
jgi:hypothetical protein